MFKTLRISLILVLLFSSVPLLTPVQAQSAAVAPLDWTGYIDGSPYNIRFPENWNGTLLVYARGYALAVDDPPDAAFGGALVEQFLLAQGYALAGSGFRDAGWAVKEGLHDTLVLTNFFREQVAEPEHIILYGISMGGLITAESIEKFPGIYDAGIPMCAPLAGASEFFDHLLNVGLAYDVAFGWPTSWGTVEDPRLQVNFYTEVLPVVLAQTYNPAFLGQNEFVRLVSGLGLDGYYLPPPNYYSFWLTSGLMTYARAELEQRAGGNPVQNFGKLYSLSAGEMAYLASLGLDAQPLLDAMNARATIVADENARNYVEHYADLTGSITRPVLTMHTQYDAVVPVEMGSAYFDRVNSAGSGEFLAQVYTTAAGHCNFTPMQLLAAVQAVEAWLENGSLPTDENFPASLGFDNEFVPAPWPPTH